MSDLRLFLFGQPRVERDGIPVDLHRRKVVALVAYLSVTGKPESRENLADLLWPKQDIHHARAGLRRSLSILRAKLGEEWLSIDRNSVGLVLRSGLWIDVNHFSCLVSAGTEDGAHQEQTENGSIASLINAVKIYRRDFLAGFFLPDSYRFDEWQLYQSENLRRQLVSALKTIVTSYSGEGHYQHAIEYARRWLSFDQLSEDAHRSLMTIYSLDGHLSAALAQYEQCKSLLANELGVEPDEETTGLLEAIKSRQLSSNAHRRTLGVSQSIIDDIRITTVLTTGTITTGQSLLTGIGSDEDEDQYLTSIKGILTGFGALVEESLSGELVAIFGYPKVHEDDAERSINAAFSIRERARRDGKHVAQGIATGMLRIRERESPDGSALRITGTCVRAASQLRHHATDDQILIDGVTHRHGRGSFEFEQVSIQPSGLEGPFFEVIKGKSKTEKAYGIPGLSAEMSGRDDDLHKLLAAASKACDGVGQIALITGDAGIGKSRLIAELRRHFEGAVTLAKKPIWLEGRCQEYGLADSYRPFVGVFHEWLSHHEVVSAAGIDAKLRSLVENGYLSEGQREEIGPILGSLYAVQFGNAWDEKLRAANPQELRNRTFQALKDLVTALSKQRPIILVLEDLHWADSLSFDLLAAFMELLAEWPILILCSYRLDVEARSSRISPLAFRKCQDRCTEITLHELSDVSRNDLFESLLSPNEISPSIRKMIVEKSQGNPFFLEEAVRSLIETNAIYHEIGIWRSCVTIETIEVSDSILRITQARMDSLPQWTKWVLQNAAAIGTRFELDVLKNALNSDVNLEQALRALMDLQFVYEEQFALGRVFAFKHDLVQQAIYLTLPPSRLPSVHCSIGEAIEMTYEDAAEKYCDRLAYHYEMSDNNEKASTYLLLAGNRARRAYSNEEAIDCYKKAITRLEKPDVADSRLESRLDALTGLMKVFELIGTYDEAEECYRKAVAAGEKLKLPPRKMAGIYLLFCYILYTSSKHEELMAHARRGLSLLKDNTECAEFVLMNLELAYAYRGKGHDEKWKSILFSIESLLRRLPYSEELIWGHVQIAMAYVTIKKEQEAYKILDELREKATKIHDLRAIAASYANEGIWKTTPNGDIQRVLDRLALAKDIYARIGDELNTSLVDAETARHRLTLGQLDAAESYAEGALDLGHKVHYAGSANIARNVLGTVYLCRGKLEEAAAFFSNNAKLVEDVKTGFALAAGFINYGRTLLTAGKRAAAGESFLNTIRYYIDRQIPPNLAASALSGLSEAMDDQERFQDVCDGFLAEIPSHRQQFSRWYLSPDSPRSCTGEIETWSFTQAIDIPWEQVDPVGNCRFLPGNGVEVHAANGRDLWGSNVGAPRVLIRSTGDFSVQVICSEVSADTPAIGGLLLWHDRDNYLRFDRGRWGRDDVSLGGCIDARDEIFGRGNLSAAALYLRIEKLEDLIRALCSANGYDWYLVGSTHFRKTESAYIGMHAIGMIDRTIYQDAYTDGTAMQFRDFQMCRL